MNYKQLLIAAKENYPQKTTVNTGIYKTIILGEITWNKELTIIYCDSCPIYYLKEDRWIEKIGD